MSKNKRSTFSGKLGFVLSAAGASVGLGNIWRFPYVAGENGGGAFLLIYILSVLLLGVPIMLSEIAIGRNTHRNAVGAYRTLSSRWSILGYNSILAPLLIMGFYLVVSGWTLEYMIHSLTGEFTRISTPEAYESLFNAFTQNPWKPLLYTVVFTLLTHGVIALGVQKGIERSARIMMPLLLLILVVLAVNSILHSKTFDNGMICASEQSTIVLDSIYDAVKAEFAKRGAYFLEGEELDKVRKTIIINGALNAKIVGQKAHTIAKLAGVDVPETAKVLIGEVESVDISEEFAHEKLSPVLAMYRAKDIDDAFDKAEHLIADGGYGHTSSIY